MVIADVAVMPLRPYTGEDEMYKVVDACIEKIKESAYISVGLEGKV